MVEDHEYTYDKTLLTIKTVGRIIKLANELALNIAPHLKERLPAIKELEILHRDHIEAKKTLAFLSRRKRSKK